MEPLNLSGKDFCNRVGIAYNDKLLKSLRSLALVGFFKMGRKYMYYFESTKSLSDKLRRGEVSIKSNGGTYYVTLND